MSTGPEELSLETIAPEDADLIDLRYEGVDLPLDENADPTQVDLACGEHLGVVSLEGGYDDESFVDLHVLGEVFRGESAYATAVRNGFVGTEAQWLETLVGPESPNAAVALAAQLAAEQAADRAEAAETGASISETASADHAAAASTARGQAEAYSDSASAYAQASLDFQAQAETSAGEALAYRNQAAQSSTDADSAAARAETAEGVSVTMRNQAQGFSEASAASSQSAETYMDESRVEAQAARDAHLLAETSRENSLAHSQASYDSAQEALARSTEAGEYASAALTSRLAAEAARDDTDVAAAAVILDRDIVIARADEAGEYAEAAESHRASALTSAGAASVSAENSAISETNAESSRVAAEAARDIAVASSGDAADALTATISYRDQAEIFSDSAGDSATAASTSATNANTSAGSAGTSATNAANSATTATTQANNAATSASTAATQATNAGNSASAAGTSATTAGTHATNAGNSATAANTSAVNAASSFSNTVISGGNSGFEDGITGWVSAWDTGDGAITNVSVNTSFQSRSSVLVGTTGASVGARALKRYPFVSGRKYRLRASVWTGGTGTSVNYFGVRCLQADGTVAGSNNGHRYFSGAAPINTTGGSGWLDYVSPVLVDADFNAGTTQFQLFTLMNNTGISTIQVAVDGIWVEDVTASEAAASSATAAATSASNASTSATNAGTSATSAATSATNASTSAGSAGTSATNAANSATTATTQANNAATSASTAATHATNAGNSASAAGTSATTAGTHATNAGNSATAANTSAVNAASSYTNTVVSGGNQDFSDGLVGWSWNTDRTLPATNYSPGWLSHQASFQGRPNVVRQTTGNYCYVYSNRLWPVQAGRTYRIRSSVWIGAVAPTLTYIGMRALDSSGAPVTGNGGHIYNVAGGVQLATNQWHDLVSAPFTTTTYAASGITNIQLLSFLNYGVTAGAESALDGIWLEDITESVTAANSATAAATSATTAGTHATNAGNSATAASASAVSAASSFTNTVLIGGNQDFDNGFTGWYTTGGTTPTAAASLGGRTNVLSLAAGVAGQWRSTKRFPVDTTRKYKISTEVYAGAGSGSTQMYIGFAAFDANGNALSHSPGSYAYCAILGETFAAGSGWHKRDSLSNVDQAPITGEGTDSWVIFPVGTRSIELLVLQNYNNGACANAVNFVTLEDITETQAALSSATAAATSASSASTSAGAAGVSATSAATQATNAGVSAGNAASSASTAATQASNASASASSASSSATIAAGVGHRALNPNAGFDNYASATVNTLPADWLLWSGGNQYRVADPSGGYSIRMDAAAGNDLGIYQVHSTGTYTADTYYVVEYEAELLSGTWAGVGVFVDFRDAALSSSLASDYASAATGADSSGVVSSTKLGRRTWTRLKLVPASTSRAYFYVMSHWSGHGSTAVANQVIFHRALIRPATAQEVAAGVALPALQASVTTTQTTVANLSTQNALARYEVVADTGGGTARLRLVSTTYGTNVLLDADKIFFGDNTVFDNAVDVLVTTNGAVQRIIALGAPFGTDGTLTEWEGASGVTWGNHSRGNAYYYRANAAPYSGGSRRLIRTDLVETDAITKEYRSDSPNADNYNTIGPITSRTTVHYITVPTTGKKISFNAQFLLQAHHTQDNYTFYVVVERLLNGVTTDVFASNIKCLTTNGDGYIHGWQMINFTDTPDTDASVQYSIRVYHTYSIGSPGNFTNYIVSHKSISIREHRTE